MVAVGQFLIGKSYKIVPIFVSKMKHFLHLKDIKAISKIIPKHCYGTLLIFDVGHYMDQVHGNNLVEIVSKDNRVSSYKDALTPTTWLMFVQTKDIL